MPKDLSAERLRKTLLVIERITSSKPRLPQNLNTETETEMNEDLQLIYRLAHTARKPPCIENHENWEDELQTLIQNLE